MKIPPKILKHHMKLSNAEQPENASPDPAAPTPTTQTPSPPASVQTEPATPAAGKMRFKPTLKPHTITKSIPKPAPVTAKPVPLEKTAEHLGNPTLNIESAKEPESAKFSAVVKNESLPPEITVSAEEPLINDTSMADIEEPVPVQVGTTTKRSHLNRHIKPAATRAENSTVASTSLAARIVSGTQLQKTPDSLPVLEAFQEFLDSEQRKMRRRMIGLSVFFTLIILLLVAGGIAGAFFFVNPMKNDVDGIRATIARLENDSNSSKESTESTIAKLNDMIKTERSNLQSATSEIETKVDGYSSNLTEVKDLIEKLQSENTTLKSQLGSINKDLPDVTYKIAAIMNEIDKMRMRPDQSTAHSPQTIAKPISGITQQKPSIEIQTRDTDPETQREATFSAMISFIPNGLDQRVICLLPIPE